MPGDFLFITFIRPVGVLIADDHPVFRYGLRALLQTEATTIEVGERPFQVEVFRKEG